MVYRLMLDSVVLHPLSYLEADVTWEFITKVGIVDEVGCKRSMYWRRGTELHIWAQVIPCFQDIVGTDAQIHHTHTHTRTPRTPSNINPTHRR